MINKLKLSTLDYLFRLPLALDSVWCKNSMTVLASEKVTVYSCKFVSVLEFDKTLGWGAVNWWYIDDNICRW